jgi:hypothetical protein
MFHPREPLFFRGGNDFALANQSCGGIAQCGQT